MPNEMADIADDFEEFWTISTRKKSKGHARLAYVRARRKASKEVIHDAYRRYCEETFGSPFICHPATWLNGERWLDEEDYGDIVSRGGRGGGGTAGQERLANGRGTIIRAVFGD